MDAERVGVTEPHAGMATSRNLVGPVVRSGDIADAVVEAVRDDNPGQAVIVEQHSAYVRIKVEQACVIRRQTIEQYLGRPFEMSELQTDLASIAGQMEMSDQQVRFYFDKIL